LANVRVSTPRKPLFFRFTEKKHARFCSKLADFAQKTRKTEPILTRFLMVLHDFHPRKRSKSRVLTAFSLLLSAFERLFNPYQEEKHPPFRPKCSPRSASPRHSSNKLSKKGISGCAAHTTVAF
jgi:hypothetical protein